MTQNNPVINSLDAFAVGRSSTGSFITEFSTRDPSTNDANYPLQKRWVNTSTGTEWILISYSNSSGQLQGNWLQIGDAGPSLNTLSGDTGGSVPGNASDNISLVGDNIITTAGNPSTSTIAFSLTGNVPASLGGSLRLISFQTASNSPFLTFTSIGPYYEYLLLYDGVTPATNGAALTFEVSTDNGATYLSTGYFSGINYTAVNSTTWNNLNSTTTAYLSGPISTARIANGQTWLHNINDGAYFYWNGAAVWLDSSLGLRSMGILAGENGSTSVNSFRVLCSTGNIAGGQFSLYGIATS